MRLQLGRPTDLISTLQNGGTETTTTKLKKKNNNNNQKTKTSKPRIFSYPLDWEVNGIKESVDFMATFLSFPKEILRDWLRT